MKDTKILMGVLIFTVAFLLQSCEPKVGKSNKVRSIGNTSEVLVVLQNDSEKDGRIGKTIQSSLGVDQYGLTQVEPIFDLAYITVNNFSEMFKKHRNILIVSIDEKALETTVESFTDRWSSPQRVINIISPSISDFEKNFPSYSPEIINNFSAAERQRILSVFRPSSKNKVLSAVRKSFGLNITVPQGFYVAKTEPGFMWIRKEVTDYSQGIIIISEPYLDEAQFSKESIVARINRDLKQYVPGESAGTYMAITDEFVEPQVRQVKGMAAEYAVEARGVWNVENDFMGGPMVSYTMVNPNNEEILTIMGYVYHPNKKKRNLLRQLEAIIYSVSFIDKTN